MQPMSDQARFIKVSNDEYVVQARKDTFQATYKEEGKEMSIDTKASSFFEDVMKALMLMTVNNN